MNRFQIISHIEEKIKRRDVFTGLVLVLTAFSAFLAGRIMNIEASRPPVVIRQFPAVQSPVQVPRKTAVGEAGKAAPSQGTYVTSKNGTKYHLPACIGAKSISEANKIWFATKADAEKAGYTPAGNCKGI